MAAHFLNDLFPKTKGGVGRLGIQVRVIFNGMDVKIQEIEKDASKILLKAEFIGLKESRSARPPGGSWGRLIGSRVEPVRDRDLIQVKRHNPSHSDTYSSGVR